jgi:hypothetical protein
MSWVVCSCGCNLFNSKWNIETSDKVSNKVLTCTVCSLATCPECRDDYAVYRSFNNHLDDIESKIFRRVCDTFDIGYLFVTEFSVVCKKCFSARTLEIYPMETAGLLVNATLIPMSAIRSRLSE